MLANLSLKTYFFIEVIEPAFVKITMTGKRKKSCEQNLLGKVGTLDFWTTLGYQGFGLFGPLWPQ